jgi:hypothetical protein
MIRKDKKAMKRSIAVLVGLVGLLTGTVSMQPAGSGVPVFAQEHQEPGMCNGRTDSNVGVNAHANGRPSEVPKYILNLSTDDLGAPNGTLVVGRGKGRLLVQEWCRMWLHQPGSESGGHCSGDEGHDPDEDIVNAHAVGIAWYKGERVLVRTDVREHDVRKHDVSEHEDKREFRLRYRAIGQHHEDETSAAEEDDGCGDESWTRIPTEGWYPLDRLKVRLRTK